MLIAIGIAATMLRTLPVKASGLVGDIDEDGDVDGRDVVLLALHWNSEEGNPRYDPNCDLNGDGKIDGKDLAMLAANFGKTE